ncbi:MAG: sigma-54-dependent Fis family transcriptional regulator, partial [Deltaproteobacteria bacterium]|nr:sigma-54-dependent Fis family transcriptional regulator [Deltaproteobacteria bacterium]
MKKPEIMIANEDKAFCHNLKKHLAPYRVEVIEAPDKIGIPNFFQEKRPNLIVLGASSPDSEDGLELTEKIRQLDRKVPIILTTRYSSEAKAIAALRAGVNDYFRMPFPFQDLAASIGRHLSDHSRLSAVKPPSTVVDHKRDETIVGDSAPMQEVAHYLSKVAATDSTVLITGETGTGKELAAGLIHRKSQRNKKPFICVNCAAVPENLIESEMFGYERGAFTGAVTQNRGKFELAEGGTVFLDEIADMHPHAQAKILRAIERKEVHRLGGRKVIPLNVRVISATNQDPEEMVKERTFREDLFYRLNVARVHLPPLRDRKEDIPKLIEHYIRNLNHRFGRDVEGLSEDAMAALMRYNWPG